MSTDTGERARALRAAFHDACFSADEATPRDIEALARRHGIAPGDLEALPGPVLPESPVGYLGAFDVDERRKLKFFSATECPFVAVAPAERPKACKS